MSIMFELTELLVSTGLPPDIRKQVIELAEKVALERVEFHRTSTGHPVDIVAERRRAFDRERQARKRDKKKTPLSKKDSSKKERKEERGVRLSETWKPTPEDWMLAERSLGGTAALAELDKFLDHWKQQPGSLGVKLDWDATWRNWVRRAAEYRFSKSPQTSTYVDGRL